MTTLAIWVFLLGLSIFESQGQGPGDDMGAYRPPFKQCYVCSGKFPDRECELYPQYVTMGPGRINCTRTYCSTIARYKPKKYLFQPDTIDSSEPLTIRPLTHDDYEVQSIARECEDYERGNECIMDPSDLAITCHSMCTEDLCNKDVPSPQKYKVSSPATTYASASPSTPTHRVEIYTTTTSASTHAQPEPEEKDTQYDVMNKTMAKGKDGEMDMDMKKMNMSRNGNRMNRLNGRHGVRSDEASSGSVGYKCTPVLLVASIFASSIVYNSYM